MTIFKDVNGAGQDVVLIHGWGCNHREMFPIAEQLTNHYRVTNIDLPGIGSSSWDVNTQTIHDVVKQVLPYLPKQAIYIGWSFGGLVAMALAAKFPERVSRFIGIGTNPKIIASDNWIGFPQPGFCAGFDLVKKTGLKALLKEDYETEFATINSKPPRFDRLNTLLDESPEIPEHILFKGIEIVDSTDLRKEFAALNCPMDFIMGSADIKVPLASIEQVKALNSKIKIHVIDKAKHMPFWTHPEEFNKILSSIICFQ